jgi:hypothetical protein
MGDCVTVPFKSAVDYAVLTLVFLPVVPKLHDGAANVLAATYERAINRPTGAQQLSQITRTMC